MDTRKQSGQWARCLAFLFFVLPTIANAAGQCSIRVFKPNEPMPTPAGWMPPATGQTQPTPASFIPVKYSGTLFIDNVWNGWGATSINAALQFDNRDAACQSLSSTWLGYLHSCVNGKASTLASVGYEGKCTCADPNTSGNYAVVCPSGSSLTFDLSGPICQVNNTRLTKKPADGICNMIAQGNTLVPDTGGGINGGDPDCPCANQCLPPNTVDSQTGQCEPPKIYTITLTGASTTEPSTVLPFNATVKDQNGVAQAGKQVTITVNVQANTGGHLHTVNRPKGTFTCAASLGSSSATCTLTTDYNGQTPFEFVATPVSGTHTITATCAGCSNTATAQVNVKVDGLIPIPAAPQLYALQDSAGTAIGAVAGKHTANHYLTSAAIGKLKELTAIYTAVNPGTKLYLNDASLEWGGLFDVGSNSPWSSPHSTHDKGRSLDIRAANNGPNNEGAVPATVFKKFISEASRGKFRMGLHCKNSSDTNYCLGQPNNRHFHVDF